jgi:hypothetical protein
MASQCTSCQLTGIKKMAATLEVWKNLIACALMARRGDGIEPEEKRRAHGGDLPQTQLTIPVD